MRNDKKLTVISGLAGRSDNGHQLCSLFTVHCSLLPAICSLFTVLGCSIEPSKNSSRTGTAVPLTFCNPINISYQYQSDLIARESADPAVIVYKGDYYLFASHGSGYWWSSDLANWNFVYSTMPEINKWAPAVCVAGDMLYLTHSQGGAIYKTNNPKADLWKKVRDKPVDYWEDPALFVDDDGRVYGYYGLSGDADLPIYGIELDPKNDMSPLGDETALIYQHKAAHGFEVSGDNNNVYGSDCWMEGAWMTKHNGKYYLQYAVPGTGDASYADGYYVSDGPLGPFTFAENNPITFKNSGFMRGAGHGSTVKDKNGAYWKFDTVSISVNHMFERRLVMVPVKFDEEGLFFANMVFSDYPMYAPHSGKGSFEAPGPGWNLLSLNKGSAASSTLAGHPLANAFDENMRTWWSAQTGDEGEWLTADLGRVCTVNAVQINFADQNIATAGGRNHSDVYRYSLELSLDGETWSTAVDRSNAIAGPNTAKDTSHDYFELGETDGKPLSARYLRLTNRGPVPMRGKFAVSGLRVFGSDGSAKPGAVTGLAANRPASDERSVHVTWNAGDPAAEGYIVVFGTQGKGLWLHHQVIGRTEARINALNMGMHYEFAVYPYGPGGVGERSVTVAAPATKPKPEWIPPELPPDFRVKGYEVYEAGKAAHNASLSGNNKASSGKIIGDMHNTGAYFEFQNVDGGPGGDAVLRLVFSSAEGSRTPMIEIFLNGESAGEKTLFLTGGWNTFDKAEFPVSGLKPGKTNTLRFVGGRGGFNTDFVQIIF